MPTDGDPRQGTIQQQVALVLPTYNERENLPLLLKAIQALPTPIHVVVVDDNSPDGTGALADELAAEPRAFVGAESREVVGAPSLSSVTYPAEMGEGPGASSPALPGEGTYLPCVEVIHRAAKLGLGTAYADGFRRALSRGADLILTMDADFSHDPRYIPALLEASHRFDLVIGSRYVPGGGVRDWELRRRMLSRGANGVAHVLLGLHARDCTAGFRCYRRKVLETVDLEAIRANGYSYLIEMLYHCQHLGFKIGEVPIIFTDRRRGQSKISQKEITKAMRTVLRLTFSRPAAAQKHAGPAAAIWPPAHRS